MSHPPVEFSGPPVDDDRLAANLVSSDHLCYWTSAVWTRNHMRMAVVEAWLRGGPADGRLMPVELDGSGRPPEVVELLQTGFYLGSSDTPAPAMRHEYVLVDAASEPVLYRYRDSASPAAE
jgi:hypothetical protein